MCLASRLLIAASCLLSPVSSSGLQVQAPPVAPGTPASAPRIGIVLEGGAALGIAHIGVLKWFEEHHIPVNYVAGTSMGGLVGGAYATGIGATGLRQLVDGIDWDEVMSGTIPYRYLAFRRKEDARGAGAHPEDSGLRHPAA